LLWLVTALGVVAIVRALRFVVAALEMAYQAEGFLRGEAAAGQGRRQQQAGLGQG
jgi:hypothetical protein